MKESDILELATAIAEKKGEITVFRGGSLFKLPPSYLVSLMTKTDRAFTAELFSVSEEVVDQYDAHFQDHQCDADASPGKRCRRSRNIAFSLNDFDNAVNRFCRVHGGKS